MSPLRKYIIYGKPKTRIVPWTDTATMLALLVFVVGLIWLFNDVS